MIGSESLSSTKVSGAKPRVTVKPRQKVLREFGLVMAVAFPLFLGLLLPWIISKPFPTWPWIVGVVFGFFGLVAPGVLAFVHKPWMKFAEILGAVNSRIVLTVFFFLVMMPIGFIMQRCRRDPMARKIDRDAATYKVNRMVPWQKNEMERPY